MPKADRWKRCRDESLVDYYYDLEKPFDIRFDHFDANRYLDIHIKEAALRASLSVVSVVSSSGGEKIFWGSGVVIECDNVDDRFFSTILTSATLVRLDGCKNSLAHDVKVDVILAGGTLYVGEIIAHDWHFNVAAINIQSDYPLPTASLRHLDDSIPAVAPSELGSLKEKLVRLYSNSNLFNLVPGDTVIALGRYHDEAYELMVALGKFSIDYCGLDCKELFRANCQITKCGIGGPLINCHGEVIGINFYAKQFTPFLPVNMVCKWWDHAKNYREYRQPWLGMEVINLFADDVAKLEKITWKCPNALLNGIIVEEVTHQSPADLAGICPNDVIIEFGGEIVHSVLEFFELSWDKVGEEVDLVVIRPSNGARLNLFMDVAGISTNQLNCWPLP